MKRSKNRILRENINSLYCKGNSLNKSFEQRLCIDYQLIELFANSLYRASGSLKIKK
ncbi:hypothetical protein EMGBS15_02920 [Filimonas sp.]|nr:hypothetical protein EMGBS15_02920 [Filimonas sp.]